MHLFSEVRYHLPSCWPPHRATELATILDANGASEVALDEATHVITNSNWFEDWQSVGDDVHIVTDNWVDRSLILGKLQPPQFYSADPAMIFSGVVASAADLPPADLEVICAGITALGGQFREGLTRDVTHLFALTPSTPRYETAIYYQAQTKMKILIPHWFDDAVKLGYAGLPTEEYEWPEPVVLRPKMEGGMDENAKKGGKLNGEKKALYRNAVMFSAKSGRDVPLPPGSQPHATTNETQDIWKGRRILVSPSLELKGGRREAVEVGIERAGGVVVRFESEDGDGDFEEEASRVDDADVLVTRYRAGAAYIKTVKAGKTIGTLPWLFFVQTTGTISRPTDQLLHYPIPRDPVEGFPLHEITVTNYTGEAREYLKKLITAMGAQFTASMSAKNTVVIAAFIGGNKTSKAVNWNIPIVNHTWLEDCFVQWQNLTVGVDKYISFPPGVDFSTVLGERGLGRVGLEGVLESEVKAETEAEQAGAIQGEEVGTGRAAMPLGTETSAKDVREVVDVVLDGQLDIDMDANFDMGMGMDQFDDHGMDGMYGMDIDQAEPEEEKRESPKIEKVGPPRRSPKKSHIKAQAVKFVSEDEEEEDGGERDSSPSKRKEKLNPTVKSKPQPKSKPTHNRVQELKKSMKYEESDDDLVEGTSRQIEEEELPPVRPATRLTRRVSQRRDELTESPRPTPTKKYGRSVKLLPDPEDSDDPGPSTRTKKPGKPVANTRLSPLTESDDDEGEEVHARPARSNKPIPKPKPTTSRNRIRTLDFSDDEDVGPFVASKKSARAPSPKPSTSKGKKALKKISSLDFTEDEGDAPVQASKKPTRRSPSPRPSTSRGKKAVTSDAPEPQPAKRTSSSLKNTVEVSIPSLRKSSSAKSPIKQVGRTESLHIEAGEASGRSSGKHERPMSSITGSKGPSTTPDRHDTPPKRTIRNGDAGIPSSSLANMSLTRTPSRRSAASKATQRLHNVIMPDVLNFEKEMKRGSVRSVWEDSKGKAKETSADVDSGGQKESKKVTGKKRLSSGDREDDGSEVDEGHDRKRRRVTGGGSKPSTTTKSRAKPIPSPESDEEESERRPPAPSAPSGGKAKKGSAAVDKTGQFSSRDPKTVKILTTQVSLDDDTVKALVKLGVKMVTEPSKCTHLISKSLARTEKLLSAMAVSPFILNAQWAIDSAKTKRIMPEEDYPLLDRDTEEKYGFKIEDALARSKESGGGLFTGMTFYVTPKVPIDRKLLKNVVVANGGSLATQTPTVRVLNGQPKRYIISCPEDVSIWRPVAQQGIIVYSPELILTGALKQEIDWEASASRVPDS
ncbi:hypothetical protein JAAARDRAFT_165491 [Jaapia argillacea MUCL 33604]|uniref:BRCT domain-containing protein n=1 Tax=Jaapia argillacea MUCL 33604 TaxID=933084 RepID=A0A067PF05_9AGAM|nr:hypothetical protein JAAARDRAFT_165491 [Jaapia argillacea MUCL 33604]